MALIFVDVIYRRHQFFKIFDKVHVKKHHEESFFVKNPEDMLIFSILVCRKIKQNKIIFTTSPRNRFSKISVYPKICFFSMTSSKIRSHFEKKYHRCVPFMNSNTCDNFNSNSTYISEDFEGADSATPRSWGVPQDPGLYRVKEYSKRIWNYFMILKCIWKKWIHFKFNIF